MTAAQMRTVSTSSPAAISRWKRLLQILSRPNPGFPSRTLAQVRSESFSELWFTAAAPARVSARTALTDGPFVRLDGQTQGNGLPGGDHKPPDERTVKLGQSMRLCLLKNIADLHSSTHTIPALTKHSHNTIASRDRIAEHKPTSLSFHSPSSAGRKR